MMPQARKEFLAGVRAQLPILLGTSPFGMIYGVLAVGAGLSAPIAIAMSSVVFAGSAQFIAAGLFAELAPGPTIVLVTLVVNLRHVLYSASMAPYVRHLSRGWRALLAFLLTDEAYAVTITHYRDADRLGRPRDHLHWYFLGAGLTLFLSWQASTALGVLLGAQVPASWGLDFTLAVTFIALLVPMLTTRPLLLAAGVAGVLGVATRGLPFNLGLILAVLTGIAAGLVAEMLQRPAGEGAV
ncbi:MAG: AzlC family ABC transporter permease [Anaerolineae bacterium]